LTREEKARIADAITEMESRTTGEIHVHVTAGPGKGDILKLAELKFLELGLDKTDERNGVLILVSHLEHRFAIWGDKAIHARAGQPLWERARQVLLDDFARRRYAQGIEACVREVGRELQILFPKRDPAPGKNQLPNEISES
jgi:uncharacterized membrane protein